MREGGKASFHRHPLRQIQTRTVVGGLSLCETPLPSFVCTSSNFVLTGPLVCTSKSQTTAVVCDGPRGHLEKSQTTSRIRQPRTQFNGSCYSQLPGSPQHEARRGTARGSHDAPIQHPYDWDRHRARWPRGLGTLPQQACKHALPRSSLLPQGLRQLKPLGL